MVKFRDDIFIGNYQDPLKLDEMNSQGITAVLNVAYEIDDPIYAPTTCRYVKVALMDNIDNPEYLKVLAVETLLKMLSDGEKVLVHCAAGMSRSVYVAIKAVSALEGKDTHDLYEELKKIHPMAMYGALFSNTYIPIGAETENG